MQNYLVFQLYGVLASWGDQAVGRERPSGDHPSRSALLGLLAAGMGIARNKEDKLAELSRQCRFGIKLYSPGQVLRDFHTTQIPPTIKKIKHLHTRRDELRADNLGTILSSREYRQDALAVVALWLEEEGKYSLDDLQLGLIQPHFHLYLGRKSCPLSIPVNPEKVSTETLKVALDKYVVDKELKMLEQTAHYYWEKTDHMGCKPDFHVARYDQPISRKRWQFSSRDEYVCLGDKEA
ncbi:CRISPR-associated protein, Cas5e family [hydrothermal vent metagenome]|uniref:CRISPR-associated protein, Cas5e family n=1 Tax=hydrothermal vent metagenome TaxID=652676 RepID=A0A3B1BJ57_9ZZZZ